MSPRAISEPVLRDAPPLHDTDTIDSAVRRLLATDLPALPVLNDQDHYVGIFGEREFMAALFPGYLDLLKGAAFLRRTLDEALERRDACRTETVGDHMNTEHIDVSTDYSDTQLAEIFLHHRVLIVPVTDGRRVAGVITRSDFFRRIGERFLSSEPRGDARHGA
jgi:CBS domain-containing protein